MRPPPRPRRAPIVAAAAAVACAAGLLLLALGTGTGPPGSATEDPAAVGARSANEPPSAVRGPAADAVREELAPVPPADGAPLRVEGRVLDDRGEPAAGAAVWITWFEERADQVAAWDLVPADGRFAFELERRAFHVQASGLDCGEAWRTVVPDAGASSVTVEDLRLPGGGTIRGRVLDVQGLGIEGLQVECTARTGAVFLAERLGHPVAAGYREGRTDAEGRFELRGLRAGEHEVDPQVRGWIGRFEPGATAIVAADGPELVFRQAADGRLRGRVTDATTGLALHAFFVDGLRFETDDGSYDTPFVRDGGVVARAKGYYGELYTPSGGDELHDFALEPLPPRPAGSLLVIAVDERGEEVAGARVRNAHENPPDRWVTAPDLEARDVERAPGRVRVLDINSVARQVAVDAPGHALVLESLKIDRERENRLEVVLERGAPVQVRVLDRAGLPARSCRFEVDSARRKERDFEWRASEHELFGRVSRTDSAQPFGVDAASGFLLGLPAGAYTLLVHTEGERVDEFAFEVHAEERRSFVFRLAP